jgi:hypothetical protein
MTLVQISHGRDKGDAFAAGQRFAQFRDAVNDLHRQYPSIPVPRVIGKGAALDVAHEALHCVLNVRAAFHEIAHKAR